MKAMCDYKKKKNRKLYFLFILVFSAAFNCTQAFSEMVVEHGGFSKDPDISGGLLSHEIRDLGAPLWSCWYWPYHDAYNPNLYDPGEAMNRYDVIAGTAAQWWEYTYHGPPQNPAPWWGHCHAWAAAACWEPQPIAERIVNGMPFRIRDRKGLLVESYHTCADGTKYELYVNDPSPGLFWRYLRFEVRGDNPMHGKKMGFVGELYYGPEEVWNYPIYNYQINYTASAPHSGTITLWVADDGQPLFADDPTIYLKVFQYQFSGVYGDGGGNPMDSGVWHGSGPYHRPDSIWRPYWANTWLKYTANPYLSAPYLKAILGPVE